MDVDDIFDIDDILGDLTADGTISQLDAPQHHLHVSDEAKSNAFQIESSIITAEIKSNLKNNELILDKIEKKLDAKNNQKKITTYLIDIKTIHRMAKHQMLKQQNNDRIKRKFLNNAMVFSECIEAVDRILDEGSIHALLMQHLAIILKKERRKMSNQIQECPNNVKEAICTKTEQIILV